MTIPRSCAGALILAFVVATPAWCEPTPAGRIKLATGAVFIVRDQKQTPAKAGDLVLEADVLRTGADGRLGVTLKDETQVSLGPSSEVRLDKFVYAPAEGNLALAMRFARGIIAYVSGRIAKLSPDAVRLETPAAIVGIRGTRIAVRVEGP
jgi:hypothetical protein